MAQSIRPLSHRIDLDLIFADHPLRAQAFPFIMRRIFGFLTATGSLTQLLREEGAGIEIRCLSFAYQASHHRWCRDVEIRAREVLQWSARTMIRGEAQYASIWGKARFLGDLIFNCKDIQRHWLQVEQVAIRPFEASGSRLWYWSRRSLWIVQSMDLSLEILEFF